MKPLFLLLLLTGGCAYCLHPVTPTVLASLPSQQSFELETWSTYHATIWDLRFHRPATCPFGYTLGYAHRSSQPSWPMWLHDFYQAKHQEQDHCECSTIITGSGRGE